VGSRAGGIPDVVDEGHTGLLVRFGDVPKLAQSIAWVLDHPQEAAQMGARGRERTLQHWTWDKVYERVRQVYESCHAMGSETSGGRRE
jgi:glycosyltransferase involved in cell wall biosynthesis